MTFSDGLDRFRGIDIKEMAAVIVFVFGAFTYTEQRINSTREACRADMDAAIDKLRAQLVAQMDSNREFTLQALRVLNAERKADDNAKMIQAMQNLISVIEAEKEFR